MATQKEQVWLNEYLQCWNATEAARRAGYKWPDKQGQEKKAKFADEIQKRLNEKQMSADEALIRMAKVARGDIGEFLEFKDGIKDPYLDLSKAKEAGVLDLIQSLEYDSDGRLKIKLYPKDSALRDILKVHGRFNENITIKLEDELDKVFDRLEKQLPPEIFQQVIEAIAGDSS